jgi:trimeric autotransporter adhesin
MNRARSLLCVAAAAAFLFARPAAGQCPLEWQPGDPIPSVHGDALASTVWDPDGAGPATPVLVVGGRFGVGAMLTTSLASFDGSNWGALGTPPLPKVTALTVWNGLLVAAGGAGNQHTVATWNGTTWSVIGNTNGAINALTVFTGNLFAGGFFSFMNGQTARNLAQWNGTTWSEPGGGVTGEVLAMTVFGSLWVGGVLTQAGPLAVSNLATWNGAAWSAGAAFDARVRCLAARNGATPTTSFVFAGGEFTTVAGVPAVHIARFTPATNAWTAMPGLPGTACSALHVRGIGLTTLQLHAAVENAASNTKVWRLNGTAWQSLGAVIDASEPLPTSLAFFNGQYVATFADTHISAAFLRKAVRIHDGTTWQAASGPGFDGPVHAVTLLGNDLAVGGLFTEYGGTSLGRLARGQPGAWQPLGSGVDGGVGVFVLCTLANGDLIAGGDFTTAGGVAASSIARWDGTTWSSLGNGVAGSVHALLPLPGGELIVGGYFATAGGVVVNNIARWNGTTWSALATGTDSIVNALARRANGDVIATGAFFTAGGVPAQSIAKWNGTSWSAIGNGLDDIGFALAVLPDDTVVVGGNFTMSGNLFTPFVARWNGSSGFAQSAPTAAWDRQVEAILALPNGDYLAGGSTSFFGLGGPFGGIDLNLARHTGGVTSFQWGALDLLGSSVKAIVSRPNGDVVVGGDFDGAGGVASHNVAVLRPTCPATAVAYGSGCAGSGGMDVLAATALPWVGATFRARATGMPAVAIALAVTGFTQVAVPMPTVLPQGIAGCTVLVSPDLLDLTLPNGGIVTTQLVLPATMSLAGQSCHHQVVPLEMDLLGNILAVTATNGLTLTIGVL